MQLILADPDPYSAFFYIFDSNLDSEALNAAFKKKSIFLRFSYRTAPFFNYLSCSKVGVLLKITFKY
jgi:hypothetical protein